MNLLCSFRVPFRESEPASVSAECVFVGVNVLYFAEMLSFVPTALAKIAITDVCEK